MDYNFFVVNDDVRFIYDIFLYLEKIDLEAKSDVPDLGSSTNFVLYLEEHVQLKPKVIGQLFI